MHTRFRFKDGDAPIQYCPLDLYSKDEARVRKAIRDLWDGWVKSDGALNNMRIFVSGKMIRPSEVRAVAIDALFRFIFTFGSHILLSGDFCQQGQRFTKHLPPPYSRFCEPLH